MADTTNDGKEPVQANGAGSRKGAQDDVTANEAQGGESAGGAYPNPHTGKRHPRFDGGQTEQAYHGTGQLGDQQTGEQPNAPSRER